VCLLIIVTLNLKKMFQNLKRPAKILTLVLKILYEYNMLFVVFEMKTLNGKHYNKKCQTAI